MTEVPPARQLLVAAALERADWSLQQLWLDYLSLGGTHDRFDLEAYLAGLLPWTSEEQDVLAVAVNERLHDLYLADLVPIPLVDEPLRPAPPPDVVQILDDALHVGSDRSAPAAETQ